MVDNGYPSMAFPKALIESVNGGFMTLDFVTQPDGSVIVTRRQTAPPRVALTVM